MKRRLTALALAGAISITTLAGCGSDDKTPAKEMMERYSPYVTLAEYKGVEYTPQVTEVTDEDIEYYIEQLIANYTTYEDVTVGTVEMGDKINIDYVGTIDGVEFEGGSTNGEGTDITLGEAGYIDDFEEQIAGHEIGDNFDVEVTFPDDYGEEALNGQDAVFNVTINSKEVTTTPEYTDEFVAENTEYDTTEAYEAYLYEYLEESNATTDQNANENMVLVQIVENSFISDYPEREITELIDETIGTIQETCESNGISVDTYIKYFYGLETEEDFKEYIRDSVITYFEQVMVVCAIAEAEGLDVTSEEVEERKQLIVETYGYTDTSELEQYYTEDDFYYLLLEEKVMNLLMENAVPVDEDGNVTETATSTDATSTDAGVSE